LIEIVPATAEHVLALYSEPPGRTLRAVAAVDGGRVLGVAGTYKDGDNTIVFAKMTDELRADKRAIVAGYRKVMRLFGRRVFAVCDTTIPAAAGFLEHMGFQQMEGEVYVWTA